MQPVDTKFADVKTAEGVTEEEFMRNELGMTSDTEFGRFWDKFREQFGFYISYSIQDVMRRKILFLIAFSAVFVSILSVLLIDVFVQKGSLIFIKMSEDTQIDATIRPSMGMQAAGQETEFQLNFTRIEELQEKTYQDSLKKVSDSIDE